MRVLNDNVLVKDMGVMQTEAGGILLPEFLDRPEKDEMGSTMGSRRYDCRMGEVLGVGEKVKDLKAGDVVYTAPLKGVLAGEQDGKEIKLFRHEEILGKLEGN